MDDAVIKVWESGDEACYSCHHYYRGTGQNGGDDPHSCLVILDGLSDEDCPVIEDN